MSARQCFARSHSRWRGTGCALAVAAGAIQALATTAEAQQLLYGKTLEQCSALGGRILTWTNTAGRGPNVGECFVPASSGAGAVPRTSAPTEPRITAPSIATPSQIGAAAGAAVQLFEGLGSLIPPAPDVQEPTVPGPEVRVPRPLVREPQARVVTPTLPEAPNVRTDAPGIDKRARLADSAEDRLERAEKASDTCNARTLYDLAFQEFRAAGDPHRAQLAYRKTMEAHSACSGFQTSSRVPARHDDGKRDLWQGCLIVSPPRRQGPTCMGSDLRLYRTDLRVNKVKGCPPDFEIEYVEPDTKTVSSWWVFGQSDYVQTCGAGPLAIRIKRQ